MSRPKQHVNVKRCQYNIVTLYWCNNHGTLWLHDELSDVTVMSQRCRYVLPLSRHTVTRLWVALWSVCESHWDQIVNTVKSVMQDRLPSFFRISAAGRCRNWARTLSRFSLIPISWQWADLGLMFFCLPELDQLYISFLSGQVWNLLWSDYSGRVWIILFRPWMVFILNFFLCSFEKVSFYFKLILFF